MAMIQEEPMAVFAANDPLGMRVRNLRSLSAQRRTDRKATIFGSGLTGLGLLACCYAPTSACRPGEPFPAITLSSRFAVPAPPTLPRQPFAAHCPRQTRWPG